MNIPTFMWLKKYFDTGYGLMNYPRALMMVIGVGGIARNWNWKLLIIMGIAYGVLCFVSGWLYILFKLQDYENEINNILNPFQREVRKKLGQKSKVVG